MYRTGYAARLAATVKRLDEHPTRETPELPACLANSSPMMMSGFLLPAIQARALSSASIAFNTLASPFSPQYKAIICLSASTL